jgi:hypothetical protein
MNPDIFAEWFRKQGQLVVRTTSSYWVKQGPGAFQAFPYHWMIEPTQGELNDLLKKHRAITLRYSAPLNASTGYVSYHTILEDAAYGYSHLSSRTRTNVRRGLEVCRVEPISFERLAGEGFSLQLDTLNRQGRKLDVEQSRWKKLSLSAGELPGFEAWGAIVDGKLAASMITFLMDDCYYLMYPQCLRQYLPKRVNNALSFTVSSELMKRPETKCIHYGLHSLDAPPSVDEFKFRMGYRAKPVRQRVEFHPWLRAVANRVSHRVTQKLLSFNPGNPLLAKAEGMLRFHLEGKRPLEKQSWPECLSSLLQYMLLAWGCTECLGVVHHVIESVGL